MKSKNFVDVKFGVHKLKSPAGYIGAEMLSDALNEVQQIIKSKLDQNVPLTVDEQ